MNDVEKIRLSLIAQLMILADLSGPRVYGILRVRVCVVIGFASVSPWRFFLG